jgi:hypothetical protein
MAVVAHWQAGSRYYKDNWLIDGQAAYDRTSIFAKQ